MQGASYEGILGFLSFCIWRILDKNKEEYGEQEQNDERKSFLIHTSHPGDVQLVLSSE
jgi:hypothetical protein